MASGERTKVWFKDAEKHLVSRWHAAITCKELDALALELTEKTRLFREQSGILPPVYYCPSCKTSEPALPPTIHGGSVLFAARRLGLIDDVKLSEQKRIWDNYAERLRRAKARQTKDAARSEQNRGSNARAAASDPCGAVGQLRLIKGACSTFD